MVSWRKGAICRDPAPRLGQIRRRRHLKRVGILPIINVHSSVSVALSPLLPFSLKFQRHALQSLAPASALTTLAKGGGAPPSDADGWRVAVDSLKSRIFYEEQDSSGRSPIHGTPPGNGDAIAPGGSNFVRSAPQVIQPGRDSLANSSMYGPSAYRSILR